MCGRIEAAGMQQGNVMKKEIKYTLAYVITVVVIGLAFVGCAGRTNAATGKEPLEALLKVVLPDGVDNEHIAYSAISVDFNAERRIPNCVAYKLTQQMVMMADAPDAEKRKNYKFNKDKNVTACPDWWEYKNSGYDRGHMAPADDMKWSREAMTECFYMTNMCPQNKSLNSGAWRSLEQKVHRWAANYGELLVFTGPIVHSARKAIGPEHDIVVPQGFFKVIYAPKQQRAIAFVYDNVPAKSGLRRHAVSVDDVERRTGIDFLSALPDDVEQSVEASTNVASWLETGKMK